MTTTRLIYSRQLITFLLWWWLLCIGCCIPLRAPSSLQRFDDRFLENLADHRTPTQTKAFRLVSNTNTIVNLGIPAGLLIAGSINGGQAMRQNAFYVASSTATSFVLTGLVKVLVKRKRPFLQNLNLISLSQPPGYSFPSGHTSSSMSTAMALSRAYPRWYVIAPAFLWSSSVAYSRMYLGVHYPTDVAAGAVLGIGSAFPMNFLRR